MRRRERRRLKNLQARWTKLVVCTVPECGRESEGLVVAWTGSSSPRVRTEVLTFGVCFEHGHPEVYAMIAEHIAGDLGLMRPQAIDVYPMGEAPRILQLLVECGLVCEEAS